MGHAQPCCGEGGLHPRPISPRSACTCAVALKLGSCPLGNSSKAVCPTKILAGHGMTLSHSWATKHLAGFICDKNDQFWMSLLYTFYIGCNHSCKLSWFSSTCINTCRDSFGKLAAASERKAKRCPVSPNTLILEINEYFSNPYTAIFFMGGVCSG